MNDSSLEARLSALELKLGIFPGAPKAIEKDANSRLGVLKSQYESATSQNFRETCAESERLMQQLDAGVALSHQANLASTPLYYRRQEVLATAEKLKEDMDQVGQALHLLQIRQPPSSEQQGDSVVRLAEEQVILSPIVNQSPISSEDERRLDALMAETDDLQVRTHLVSKRVDNLLDLYNNVLIVASEKLVLADEEISFREQQKK